MAVLMNIPHGLTNRQLKTMQESVNKTIPEDSILVKTLSFMFDTTSKTYVYTDNAIKSTSVVTVVLGDNTMAFDCGIDYRIDVMSGNVTFTCESIPQDDVGNASVAAMIKIVNL